VGDTAGDGFAASDKPLCGVQGILGASGLELTVLYGLIRQRVALSRSSQTSTSFEILFPKNRERENTGVTVSKILAHEQQLILHHEK
jgi:hypothetical protein